MYDINEDNIYHPGKSSSLRLGKNIVAKFGELHPILLKTMDINIKVYGFEIFLDKFSISSSLKVFSTGSSKTLIAILFWFSGNLSPS